jgi:hypothetical protein
MFSELYWFTICLDYIYILLWFYLLTPSWSQKNYREYFLLTGGDTCGLVFSNMVIAALFDCMEVVWHMINIFWLELHVWWFYDYK